MTGIAIVPAKFHSVRCPAKNWLPFHGKWMFAHSIETARASRLFSDIIVSIDDSRLESEIVQHGGSPQYRGPRWNELGTQELAARVLEKAEAHQDRLVCVIYATAPLLSVSDLEIAHQAFDPLFDNYVMGVGADPLRDAGAFYMGLAGTFMERVPLIGARTRMHVIPEDRVCDINTHNDLEEASQKYIAWQARKVAAVRWTKTV